MDPATCNQRVEALTTQLRQLEAERDALKAKRSTLDLPSLKKDFLDQILNNLGQVVGAVPRGIGIGAPKNFLGVPSHTTRHAGPHRAVREVEVTRYRRA